MKSRNTDKRRMMSTFTTWRVSYNWCQRKKFPELCKHCTNETSSGIGSSKLIKKKKVKPHKQTKKLTNIWNSTDTYFWRSTISCTPPPTLSRDVFLLTKFFAWNTKTWSQDLRYLPTIMKIKQTLQLFTFEIGQFRFVGNSFQIYENLWVDLFITRLEVYSVL